MKSKRIFIYLSMALLFGLMALIVFPFIPSIVIGSVLATVTYPLYTKALKIGLNSRISALIIVVLFTLIILVPVSLLAIKGTQNAVAFFNSEFSLEKNLKELEIVTNNQTPNEIKALLQKLGLPNILRDLLKAMSTFLVGVFQSFIKSIPFVTLSLFVGLITMYFGLVEGREIYNWLIEYSFLSNEKTEQVSNAFKKSCNNVIVANLLGGLIQSLVASIAAIATSTPGLFLIGFSTFLLSFVPLIGTAPVTLGISVFYLAKGAASKSIIWLVVGALIGLTDNFVRAWALSDSSDLHPYIGLLSVIGGLMTLGISGLIIGPLIASILTKVLPILINAKNSA